MATQVQWRRGTTPQVAAFTGAVGEVVIDTTLHALVVQDGVTAGGFYAARRVGDTLTNVTIAGTMALSSVTLSGTATSTATISGGIYASPTLTGTPVTPTQSFADDSTTIVNSHWVRNVIQISSPINLALAAVQPILNFNSPSGT